MTTASRQLTTGDFLLFGSAIALLIIVLWPVQSDHQWVVIEASDGNHQSYLVPVDDPRLQVLKRHLENWKNPTSSRDLRIARWYQEVADFYLHRDATKIQRDVAQVSFVAGVPSQREFNQPSYWSLLRRQARIQVAKAEQDLRVQRQSSVPPVNLGPVAQSIRPKRAYAIAILSATLVVLLGTVRQRSRPPIQLACDIDSPQVASESTSIPLQIPASWIRIHQPLEVRLWRMAYRTAVVSAAICLLCR